MGAGRMVPRVHLRRVRCQEGWERDERIKDKPNGLWNLAKDQPVPGSVQEMLTATTCPEPETDVAPPEALCSLVPLPKSWAPKTGTWETPPLGSKAYIDFVCLFYWPRLTFPKILGEFLLLGHPVEMSTPEIICQECPTRPCSPRWWWMRPNTKS